MVFKMKQSFDPKNGNSKTYVCSASDTGSAAVVICRSSHDVNEEIHRDVPINSPHDHIYEVGTIADQDYEGIEYPEIAQIPEGAAREAWLSVVADMNAHDLAFTVFIGDIGTPWDGVAVDGYASVCDVENGTSLEDKVNILKSFRQPLIYTPGDNEWSQCYQAKDFSEYPYNYDLDPIAQLEKLRQLTQPHPHKSLGQRNQLKILRQPGYPENVMFIYGPVLYVTINIPSGNNSPQTSYNVETDDQMIDFTRPEMKARQAANVRWLNKAFKEANHHNTKGIYIAEHADLVLNNAGTAGAFPACDGVIPDGGAIGTSDTYGPQYFLYTATGPRVTTPIAGPVTVVNDGPTLIDGACQPVAPGSLVGTIAVVIANRNCNLGSGTLVLNIDAGDPLAIILISDNDSTTYNGNSSATVPTVSLTKTDGDEFLAAIAADPSMILTLTAAPTGTDVDNSNIEVAGYTEIITTINDNSLKYRKLEVLVASGDSHQLRFGRRFANRKIKTVTTYGSDESEGYLYEGGETAIINANRKWLTTVVNAKAKELFVFNAYSSIPSPIKTSILHYRYGTKGEDEIKVKYLYDGPYQAVPVALVPGISQIASVVQDGSSYDFDVEVPANAVLLAVSLVVDTLSDVDLYVYSENGDIWANETAYNPEYISIEYPAAGIYTISAAPYCTNGRESADIKITYWIVTRDNPNYNLKVKNSTRRARPGKSDRIEYEWKNLQNNQLYLGAIIHQSDNQVAETTFLRIETPGYVSTTL